MTRWNLVPTTGRECMLYRLGSAGPGGAWARITEEQARVYGLHKAWLIREAPLSADMVLERFRNRMAGAP